MLNILVYLLEDSLQHDSGGKTLPIKIVVCLSRGSELTVRKKTLLFSLNNAKGLCCQYVKNMLFTRFLPRLNFSNYHIHRNTCIKKLEPIYCVIFCFVR